MRLLRKLPWGQEILRRESSVRDAPGPDMAEAEREATQADEAPHRYFDAKTGEWKPKPPVQVFLLRERGGVGCQPSQLRLPSYPSISLPSVLCQELSRRLHRGRTIPRRAPGARQLTPRSWSSVDQVEVTSWL